MQGNRSVKSQTRVSVKKPCKCALARRAQEIGAARIQPGVSAALPPVKGDKIKIPLPWEGKGVGIVNGE